VTRAIVEPLDVFFLFPAKHFITDKAQAEKAFKSIKAELEGRLEELKKEGKPLEAERLKRRVSYDLAMIREVGYTNGIENYSRHFSGMAPGQPPDTLLSYFPHKADGTPDFLTIIDESHVTLSQIGGMQAGDASRKKTLIEQASACLRPPTTGRSSSTSSRPASASRYIRPRRRAPTRRSIARPRRAARSSSS
jgi:excinuclease ABC subunit B